MATDYISRERALDTQERMCRGCPIDRTSCDKCAVTTFARQLREIPAADVRPVVHSRWIYHEDDYGDYYECANCHDEYVVYEGDMTWKICPTCGADMREAENGS